MKPAKVTVPSLRARKNVGPKIAVLTAYDATMARLFDEAGVDVLLVGDSLGMVVQGQVNTLGVTVDEVCYHGRCVTRGASRAHIVGDMPFMSFQVSSEDALRNAGYMMKNGGFESVKLEGGVEVAEHVRRIVSAGIPVMGHVGLTPQSFHAMGGFRVQGKSNDDAARILADAKALEAAGAYSVVLEGIPADLAAKITASLDIPTIGIGAGPQCDGQVLVSYDMLGMFRDIKPKFVKRFGEFGDAMVSCTKSYIEEVRSGVFPAAEHSFGNVAPRPAAETTGTESPKSSQASYGPTELVPLKFCLPIVSIKGSVRAMLPPLPRSPHVFGHVLDLVGDTPLVEIRKVGSDTPRARVFAKCEQFNPGGSVKDRIALSMIEDAERRGQLKPGGVVIEPTSGNTGIGLAIVCASKGYRCVLTMPASMSLERRQLLEAFGAEIVLTEPEKQMDGAIAKAKELASTTQGAFMPQQFDNRANPDVHQFATAREIIKAMGDLTIDAFIAAVGTGGTISGVGEVLRSERPEVKIIAVEPETSATISRGERGPSKIQGIAAGFVPANYRPEFVHEVRLVSDRLAYDTKISLAKQEGLLVGISAGANVAIALEVARELGPSKNVVTVLCDTGERYFSLDEYFKETA